MLIKVNRKTHIICVGISLILVAILYKPISDISFLLYMEGFNSGMSVLILCILMIPVSLIHELIHAAAFKSFGGVVKIGVKGLYAYTQELSGSRLTRTQYAIVLLSPASIISILAILIPGWVGTAVFILNIFGSLGDLYIAFSLMKYGQCKIIDRPEGFEVIRGV